MTKIKFKVGDFVSIVQNQIPDFKKYSGYLGEIRQIGSQYVIKLEPKYQKDGGTNLGLPITKNAPVLINDPNSPYHGQNGLVKHKQGKGLYQLELLGGSRKRKIFHQDKFKILYNEIKVDANLVSELLRKEMVGGAGAGAGTGADQDPYSTEILDNEICRNVCNINASKDKTRRRVCPNYVDMIFGTREQKTKSRECYISKSERRRTCCAQYRTLKCGTICGRNKFLNPSQYDKDAPVSYDFDNRKCFISSSGPYGPDDLVTTCEEFKKSKDIGKSIELTDISSESRQSTPSGDIHPEPTSTDIVSTPELSLVTTPVTPGRDLESEQMGLDLEQQRLQEQEQEIMQLQEELASLENLRNQVKDHKIICKELEQQPKDIVPFAYDSTGFFTKSRQCLQDIKVDDNNPKNPIGYRKYYSNVDVYRDSRGTFPDKEEVIENLNTIIRNTKKKLRELGVPIPISDPPVMTPPEEVPPVMAPGVSPTITQGSSVPPGLPPRPDPKPVAEPRAVPVVGQGLQLVAEPGPGPVLPPPRHLYFY